MAHKSKESTSDLAAVLNGQRAAFLRDGPPTLAGRRRDLMKLKDAILRVQEAFVATLNSDFGHRSRQESLVDLGSTISTIKYLHGHLKGWMRPERRQVGAIFWPASAKVVYQPLGVVGIISAWNMPLSTVLQPLATALASGNRVMLKPSELTPATTALMADMLGEIFDEKQVAVVKGDAKVGSAFASLPFDRILFTGSTRVGRAVMRAASENLVPLTLELGGKSPVIIERGYSLEIAARRIAYGKLTNSGQICVAPDYVLLHTDEVDRFVHAYTDAVDIMYPNIAQNPYYTWIVNDFHFARLAELLEDARAKGARIIELGKKKNGTEASKSRQFQPTLVLNANDAMKVMQEEIFGPILPIITYKNVEDAIAYVNARPRPLSLYFFGTNAASQRLIVERTTSGNVSINDTILQYAQDDIPFGGVGPSGMGAYHGEEGFKTMSHAKGVFTQARWSPIELCRPPFGRIFDFLLRITLR